MEYNLSLPHLLGVFPLCIQIRSECLRVLDLSLFHIIPKAVHLEDFVSLQNQVPPGGSEP